MGGAYAMLENQDSNVGRLLRKLEELKLSGNTIVLYFSDNGPNGHRWTGATSQRFSLARLQIGRNGRYFLPARDGISSGGIKRSGRAPNCSYFINWTSSKGKMTWIADVHTAGKYHVSIDYTCPAEDMGSTIPLSFKGANLTGKVDPGWDPPIKSNQDTVPRNPVESQMKDFKTLASARSHSRQAKAILSSPPWRCLESQ